MTKLQIKAIEYGVRLIKEATIPYPYEVTDDKEETEVNRRVALADRCKTQSSIEKGLEWISTATEDGKL